MFFRYFWIFQCFFRYFWIFLKIYQNIGQKLGSNRCPLFTMLTKQNSSMFRIVSFVKKNSKCFFLFFCFFFFTWDPIRRSPWTKTKICVVGLTWDLVRRSPLTRTNIVCGWANLRSRPTTPFNQNQNLVCGWANLRSHRAIPFNQNHYPVCGWANLGSRSTIPFNQNQYPVWLG
jgi:hypothetical protein